MDLITPEDLAYMRATQAEARPTEATWAPRTAQRDDMGGTTPGWDWGTAQPVQARLHDPDDVPADLASRYGSAALVQITLDLVNIKAGDRVRANGITYEVVSSGDPGEWTTAQVVWAVRQ